MPRKWSKGVPESNGSVPHHDEFGSDQPTMADLYRMSKERFDRLSKQFGGLTEKRRVTNQRLAGLEHEARQPRFATEANVEPDTKTRKRTEDAVAHGVMDGASSSLSVDGGPMSLTSFGTIAEPPAPENSIGDALIDKRR